MPERRGPSAFADDGPVRAQDFSTLHGLVWMRDSEPLIIKGFASPAELDVLAAWALGNFDAGRLRRNGTDFRHFSPYHRLSPCETFERIRIRLVERLGMQDFRMDPHVEDYASVILPGGFVHLHTDPALPGHNHARANLLCGFPDAGGMPVISGTRYRIEPGDIWMFLPSEARHFCELVVGSRPRVNCSFGFQAPVGWWEALPSHAWQSGSPT